MHLDWSATKNRRIAKAYYQMFLASDSNLSYSGPGVTYDQWKNGTCCVFLFDAKDSKSSGIPQPLRRGQIQISMLFKQALTKAVSVFLYTESSAILCIDKEFNAEIRDVEENKFI